MWQYEKKLQYPVRIKRPNPKLAQIIISQYGGPDGELGASLRYLSQRFAMPYPELKGLLTDIGTEELGHLEMIGAIVYQLTRNLTPEQIKTGGFDAYFVDHTAGVYPSSAAVAPGPMLPPAGMENSAMSKVLKSVPSGRRTEPEDLVSAILFIIGCDSLTGAVIPVDGGQHLKNHADL